LFLLSLFKFVESIFAASLFLKMTPNGEYKTQGLKGLNFKKTFLGNRVCTFVFTEIMWLLT
ncbi:MAG: hypothetical protein ACK5EP_09730, partial [Bacteroidota bacterium]